MLSEEELPSLVFAIRLAVSVGRGVACVALVDKNCSSEPGVGPAATSVLRFAPPCGRNKSGTSSRSRPVRPARPATRSRAGCPQALPGQVMRSSLFAEGLGWNCSPHPHIPCTRCNWTRPSRPQRAARPSGPWPSAGRAQSVATRLASAQGACPCGTCGFTALGGGAPPR